MTHDNDGAKPGSKVVICGCHVRRFFGRTLQEAADACRAHVEAHERETGVLVESVTVEEFWFDR